MTLKNNKNLQIKLFYHNILPYLWSISAQEDHITINSNHENIEGPINIGGYAENTYINSMLTPLYYMGYLARIQFKKILYFYITEY